MTNWEFFLQTIGDENWVRLTSPQPDIPSGHYRLAARALHHAYELIEIEVKTRQTLETLMRTQQRQYSCQLDGNGFGILVEDIQLTPGFWEIQCRRELINAFTQPDWEIKLSPRVTLRLEKARKELNPETKGELTTTTQDEPLEVLRSRFIDDADQVLEEVVSDVFSNADQDSSSQKWRGIFPPKLVSKGERKKRTSPELPNLPNTIVREKQPKPKKEYVWSEITPSSTEGACSNRWSKPDNKVAQDSQILEWELIPELVITSEDIET